MRLLIAVVPLLLSVAATGAVSFSTSTASASATSAAADGVADLAGSVSAHLESIINKKTMMMMRDAADSNEVEVLKLKANQFWLWTQEQSKTYKTEEETLLRLQIWRENDGTSSSSYMLLDSFRC